MPDFHRFGECACFSWLSTVILCLSASVDSLSLLDMYLPVFSVLLVCVCVFVSRCAPEDKQTQSFTHKYGCLFVFLSIPDILLSNSDSLSLLIQSYTSTCILVCLCMCIFVLFLFALLSTPYSWLLTLYFSSIQVSWIVQQPVVGPVTGHF